ncbi:MAG: O-antigen ligase family protein [Acidobacteriota bacterium]
MSGTTSSARVARSTAPVVLAIAIAWPALAFGGVYPWAWGTLMAICAAFAACAIAGSGWRLDPVLTTCAALVAAAISIQLLPLTPAILHAASPAAARFLEHQDLGYMLAAAAGTVKHPLSIDPSATWLFLGFFVSMAALFVGVASIRATTSLRFVPASVTAIGTALALVGILQAGVTGERMYGVWAPLTHAAVFGPFVNRNHFATWMLLALPVAIAQCAARLASMRREADPGATVVEMLGAPGAGAVLLTGFACFLMSAALLMTRSRSGFGGFVVVVAAMIWAQVRHRRSIRAAAPAVVLLLALAAVTVAWIGWRPLVARLDELPGTRLSGRLDAWSEAARIARDFWLTGSGLNTYATAMLTYHDPKVFEFFRTPHNDYLQVLCDGGLLVGVPLGLLLGVLAVRVVRGSTGSAGVRSFEKWTRYGAAVGVTAVALQELVEFGLQTPANAVLFTVLVAYASGPRHDPGASSSIEGGGVVEPVSRRLRVGRAAPPENQSGSRCTVSGENAGRQTATYSAPPASGVL